MPCGRPEAVPHRQGSTLLQQRPARQLITRKETWSTSLNAISYQNSVHQGKACKRFLVHHPRNYQVHQTSSGKRCVLTFLLGTHMGVPCFTWPASTTTPITIGSRELKMNWGSIFILQGNTAICLEDDKEKAFWNRPWNGVHNINSSVFSHTSWAFIPGVSLGETSSRKKMFSGLASSSQYLIFKNYREQ